MITNQAEQDEQNEQGQAEPDSGLVSKLLNSSVIILGQNEQKLTDMLFRCGGCNLVTEGETGDASIWVIGVQAPNGSQWAVQARVQTMLSNKGSGKLCNRCVKILALSVLRRLAGEAHE